MTFLGLFRLMRKNLVLVIALPIICCLITGLVCWALVPVTYTATTTMHVQADREWIMELPNTDSTVLNQTLCNDVATILKSDKTKEAAAKALGIDSLSGYSVSTSLKTASRDVVVSVAGKSPELAASIANEVVHFATISAKDMPEVESIDVVNKAIPPSNPSSTSRLVYVAVALVAGFFLALTIIIMRDTLDTRIRRSEEIEKALDVPVLGKVPVEKGGIGKSGSRGVLSSFEKPQIRNAAEKLYVNMLLKSSGVLPDAVAVTSSIDDEGKTTIALMIAREVASSGKRVLIVDGDMRKNDLTKALGGQPEAGIGAYIENGVSVDQVIEDTDVENLFFLGTGQHLGDPVNMILDDAFKRMVETLKTQFDFIVFDTPQLKQYIDAVAISSIVDASVLVAGVGVVDKDTLISAYEQLVGAEHNLLGVCINFDV